MDKDFSIVFYNTIREYHHRYASQECKEVVPVHKEEMLFYFAQLRAAIKFAHLLELQLDEKIAGIENATAGISKGSDQK